MNVAIKCETGVYFAYSKNAQYFYYYSILWYCLFICNNSGIYFIQSKKIPHVLVYSGLYGARETSRHWSFFNSHYVDVINTRSVRETAEGALPQSLLRLQDAFIPSNLASAGSDASQI